MLRTRLCSIPKDLGRKLYFITSGPVSYRNFIIFPDEIFEDKILNFCTFFIFLHGSFFLIIAMNSPLFSPLLATIQRLDPQGHGSEGI